MADDLLVLWDIDQTLIQTTGVATAAYAATVRKTTGHRWRGDMHFNGLTERAMVDRILRMHDVEPDDALRAEFLAQLVAELHDAADDMRANGQALAGAAEALDAVAESAGVRQSVLTGNVRSVAELKLELFGLGDRMDFSIGAYGDDDFERTALLPHAWRRASERYGHGYGPAQTVLIGDTRRDVEAALAHGAGIVAVASGMTSAADLAEAGAAVVLADLTDTGAVLAGIRRAAEVAGAGGRGGVT